MWIEVRLLLIDVGSAADRKEPQADSTTNWITIALCCIMLLLAAQTNRANRATMKNQPQTANADDPDSSDDIFIFI